MKKLVVLAVYLGLLLVGGGQYLNAGTPKNPNCPFRNSEKKHRVKFTNQDSRNSLIEDTDLNIGEEHLGGNVRKRISDKIFTGNYSLLDNWYLTFSCQSLLDHCQNNLKIFMPFHRLSNPIYITQRVLRI